MRPTNSTRIDGAGTIVDLLVPTEAIALETALGELSGARVEIEQAAVHDSPGVVSYLWVRGAEQEEIEAAFAADGTIDVVSRPAGAVDEWLYRIEWAPAVQAAIESLRGDTGTILTAIGTDESWRFRILFPTREALGQAHDGWTATSRSVEVQRVSAVDAGYVSNASSPGPTSGDSTKTM